MGGPGTAFYTNYSMMYNPALISQSKGLDLSLVNIPVSISNDIFKFIKFYRDNQDDLENFEKLSYSRQTDLMKKIADTVTKYRVRVKTSLLNPSFSMGPMPLLGPATGWAYLNLKTLILKKMNLNPVGELDGTGEHIMISAKI
ncbi:MAG: hypothetical protein ACOC5R_00080 [Elusimicrobiota bacterium]